MWLRQHVQRARGAGDSRECAQQTGRHPPREVGMAREPACALAPWYPVPTLTAESP